MTAYLSFWDSIWLLIIIISFCIGFILPSFYDGFKLRFNIFAQYFYSKVMPHHIGNRTVYLINDREHLFRIVGELNFYYTKFEKIKAFFIKMLGDKESLTRDEVEKIESLSTQFIFLISAMNALSCNIIERPKLIQELFIDGKPLFIEDFFKILDSEPHTDEPDDRAAQEGDNNSKDACNNSSHIKPRAAVSMIVSGHKKSKRIQEAIARLLNKKTGELWPENKAA